MRRVGVLFLAGVMLAGSAATGCATSEPAGRAGASAPPSQSSQAEVESTHPPRVRASRSPRPASTSAPAQESTGDAENPRTESGSDPRPVEAPRPVGVSLSELAAMVIDPLKEVHGAGIDIRLKKLEKYGMTPNALFTHTLALPWYSPSDPAIAGLVVGFRRHAWAENGIDDSKLEGERGEYAPYLSASVLAFDSTAHAREYVKWLPSRTLDQADKPVRAALPAAGKAAVLWRSGSGRHFRDLALIRRGNLVGEVVAIGFTTDGHGEAIEPLARALADQMAKVRSRARPYDAAAVLAAPLPSDAWAALGEDRSSYPELVSCEMSFSECDVESIWGDPWADAPADSSALHLALADGAGYPVTGTELIAYNSESEAADAMGDIAARWLDREGGEKFTVPGVKGAVGVRTGTLSDLYDPSEERIGYTWNVLFTHGSALARAFVAGGPSDYFGPNEQWAIDAAQAWQHRLDVILR